MNHTGAETRFQELERAAAARGEIALGLRCTSAPEAGLALNPDRDRERTLASGDELVVLRSHSRPRGEE